MPLQVHLGHRRWVQQCILLPNNKSINKPN
jgi:hypothetical protein